MSNLSKNRPLFITFEGGEGAGKSTLMGRLAAHFPQVLTTREPGGTPLGEAIRGLLLHREGISIAPKAELLLFLAARAQHLEEVIIPALESGKTVLCDRFHDSTIVYQGVARGLGMDFVEHLTREACGEPLPDLTFYLDVPPEIGLRRAAGRGGEGDRIGSESLAFHNCVREGFLQRAAVNPRMRVIDASQPLDAVYESLLRELP